jgi:hypothetical protein
MSTIDINKDITATLGPDAMGCSSVMKYLRETQATYDTEPTPISIEEECQRLIDRAILLAFAEELFASVRRTASKRPAENDFLSALMPRVDSLEFTHLEYIATIILQ